MCNNITNYREDFPKKEKGNYYYFGILVTGAIARTAANIKSGGRTPVAGIGV